MGRPPAGRAPITNPPFPMRARETACLARRAEPTAPFAALRAAPGLRSTKAIDQSSACPRPRWATCVRVAGIRGNAARPSAFASALRAAGRRAGRGRSPGASEGASTSFGAAAAAPSAKNPIAAAASAAPASAASPVERRAPARFTGTSSNRRAMEAEPPSSWFSRATGMSDPEGHVTIPSSARPPGAGGSPRNTSV